MLGIVKRIRVDRGFGFIRPSGDRRGQGDHFFHANDLDGIVFDELLLNVPVEFESVVSDKGLAAQNVRLAPKGASGLLDAIESRKAAAGF